MKILVDNNPRLHPRADPVHDTWPYVYVYEDLFYLKTGTTLLISNNNEDSILFLIFKKRAK